MNTDSNGNKVADKKISKKDQSRNVREKRITRLNGHMTPEVESKAQSKLCGACGFHIRSKNHVDGAHHKQTANLRYI